MNDVPDSTTIDKLPPILDKHETFAYDGKAGHLAKIATTNGLLTLITFIYRFWGKTRLRQYLWGHVSFRGDRFEYSGTAKELLIGFLVALLILLPIFGIFVALELSFLDSAESSETLGTLQGVVFLFLIQLAIFRARRYRLTRTQWRGIRGGQTGSAFKYAFIVFGWVIVLGITLGFAYPFYRSALQRYRTENTWFGDKALVFEGTGKDLFLPWVLGAVLFIPTLGISYAWYRVKEFRYFLSKTTFGNLSFESSLSTIQIALIYIFFYFTLGLMVVVLSALVGVVFPEFSEIFLAMADESSADSAEINLVANMILIAFMVVFAVLVGVLRILMYLHPLFRVLCMTTTVIGEEDFARIAQSQAETPTRGEGLADALDVGAI